MPAARATVVVSPATLNKAERLARARRSSTITATEAQKSFAEVLETARRNPVTVTRKGKPAAVVLSARRYREWVRLLEEMEDNIWLAVALDAEKEGLVSREESDKLLRELREEYGG